MAHINPQGAPGGGFIVAERIERVRARGGAVVTGYVYPFCDNTEGNTAITDDGATVSINPGDAGYVYGNIKGGVGATTANQQIASRVGMCCLALEDFADGETGRVLLWGIAKAYVGDSGNTTVAFGKELNLQVAGNGTTTGAAGLAASYLDAKTLSTTAPVTAFGRKTFAKALGTISSSPSTGSLIDVWFDGIEGLGGAGNA